MVLFRLRVKWRVLFVLDKIDSVNHLFVYYDVVFVIWYWFLKWVGRLMSNSHSILYVFEVFVI